MRYLDDTFNILIESVKLLGTEIYESATDGKRMRSREMGQRYACEETTKRCTWERRRKDVFTRRRQLQGRIQQFPAFLKILVFLMILTKQRLSNGYLRENLPKV